MLAMGGFASCEFMRQPQLTNPTPSSERIASAAIRKAKRHIEEHFTEKISSRDLAQMVSLSPEHFCRTFKQATGLRVTEYIASLRVNEARRTLTASNQLIGDIGLSCGFETLGQFNRMFKKLTGETPTQYRSARRARLSNRWRS